MDNKSKELTMFEKMQITDEYLDETDCVMMSKVVKHLLDDLAETVTDLHHAKYDLIKFKKSTFSQRLHYLFTGRLD